jgi:hypothetical protein
MLENSSASLGCKLIARQLQDSCMRNGSASAGEYYNSLHNMQVSLALADSLSAPQSVYLIFLFRVNSTLVIQPGAPRNMYG